MKTDFSFDIYRYQKIIDPFIIGFIYILNKTNKFSLFLNDSGFFFLLVVIIFYILNSENIYINSKRMKIFKSLKKNFYFSLIIALTLFGLDSILMAEERFYLSKIITFVVSCNLYLYLSHVAMIQFFRKLKSKGWNNQNIIYVGGYESAKEFFFQNKKNNWVGYKFIAWFSPFVNDLSKDLDSDFLCEGTLNKIEDFLNTHKIDKIIFSTETEKKNDINNILLKLGNKAIPVSINPYWVTKSMSLKKNFIGESLIIDIWSSKLTFTDRILKRLMDLVLSFLILIITSPIILLTCFIIKISSPGPIIFKQSRYGLSGIKFNIYKFRSMNVTEAGDTENLKSAKKNDPRFYPFGSIIRKFSVDELPQLFNVIKGDMSIVGPRPHAVNHNEIYKRLIPEYMQRHILKPGITGLAQVNGLRGEIKHPKMMQKRVEMDLEYLNNWSIKLDFSIIFETIFNINTKQTY